MDFGWILVGFGLASAGFGLDFALSLAFTRICSFLGLPRPLLGPPGDLLGLPRTSLSEQSELSEVLGKVLGGPRKS